MKPAKMLRLSGLLFFLLQGSYQAVAGEIRIAVASNFTDAMKHISERFEASSGHEVTLIFGSTGKHYAQIRNGAPFDVFFAADSRRPKMLEEEGIAVAGSRFTYATGKLVLWSPKPNYVDAEGKVLEAGKSRYLAIANPKLAPYGRAARQVMQHLGVWESLQQNSVRGENIGQAYQFVKSGNAELGFVAFAQIKHPGTPVKGSFWVVPQSLYDPIRQQAVLLKDSIAARAFLDFVKMDHSQETIRGFGYGAASFE